MPMEEADIICDRERLQKAQILLDLFEEDCGRTADTLEEVGEWAVKNRGHLDVRMERRLLELLHRKPEQQSDAAFGVRPPSGWRSFCALFRYIASKSPRSLYSAERRTLAVSSDFETDA